MTVRHDVGEAVEVRTGGYAPAEAASCLTDISIDESRTVTGWSMVRLSPEVTAFARGYFAALRSAVTSRP